jgi:hypothetical protein
VSPLSQMRPALPVLDGADQLLADSVCLGESVLGRSLAALGADGGYLGFAEAGAGITLASNRWPGPASHQTRGAHREVLVPSLRAEEFRVEYAPVSIPGCAPAFGCPVGRVVLGRSQEQVIGVDARRLVATMADAQALGDRPHEQGPGGAVGSTLTKPSVSERMMRSSPPPASGGWAGAYLLHEPNLGWSTLGCHAGSIVQPSDRAFQ